MDHFIVTHQTVVLDADFEKCELSGFVELTVALQKQCFYIKRPYHDSNHDRIGLHLPALGSETNLKIHEVTVDGISTKYQERPRYLKRANKNFSDIADLHNFETLFLCNVADVMDYGELMITIPPELLCKPTCLSQKKRRHDSSITEVNEPPRKKRKLCNGVAVHQSNHHHNNNSNGDSTSSTKMDDNRSESCQETEDDNVSMQCDEENYFSDGLLEPFIVKIAFTVKEPIDGIHWVVPRDNKDGTPSVSLSVSSNSSSSTTKSSSPGPRYRKVHSQRTRLWGAVESEEVDIESKKSEVLFVDRKPHMYSFNVNWLPCLNGLKYRCPYRLQLTVPTNYIAICNGELLKSTTMSSKSVFIYDIGEPVLARNLTFAMGPFREIILNDVLPDVAAALSPNMQTNTGDAHRDDDDDENEEKSPETTSTELKANDSKKDGNRESKEGDEEHDPVEDDDDDDGDDHNNEDGEEGDDENVESESKQKRKRTVLDESVCIKIYILPEHLANVITTCFNIPRMIKVYEQYLTLPFPFSTLSFVFVDEAYRDALSFLNLNILSNDSLHTESQIETSYATNEVISRCIAENWMKHALNVWEMSDLWIRIGFTGLLHYEWLVLYEGRNEMEYRRAMWRYHREETGPHPHAHPKPPLSWNGYLHEQQLFCVHYEYIRVKSMFVMRMLQQLLGSQSFRRNVTKNILYGHMNGKFVNGERSTISTAKLHRHLSGFYAEGQIDEFFANFVYGDSCPRLQAEYQFVKKSNDNRHELLIRQEESNGAYCNVVGKVKMQIQELDHETIEYVQVPRWNEEEPYKLNVVCRSRAKRKKKNSENPPWMEAPARNLMPTKWIRIDPDYEWLFHIVCFVQPSEICITQLLYDDVRDVKSQIEAISSLRLVPGKDTSEALLMTVNDDMNFYKVRLEAARALAEDRNPGTLHENKAHLINVIKKLWHEMRSDALVRRNVSTAEEAESTKMVNYFMLKQMVFYLSKLSEHKHPHCTPIEIVDLIVKILKELIDDDATKEALVESMILSLGNVRVSPARHCKIEEIVIIIDQILSLQRLFRSHSGIVRSACLKTLGKLALNHPTQSKLTMLAKKVRKFCTYGKFHDNVRITAFEIMVQSMKDCKKTVKKCLSYIAKERVPGVRLKMLRIWARCNAENDYFLDYEEEADAMHRVQKKTSTATHSVSVDQREDHHEEREERLFCINLRPTLRGYRAKNFVKNGPSADGILQITESNFLPYVLRNSRNLNQKFIAQTIWNILLRALDRRQADIHRDSAANQPIVCSESDSRIMTKSMDLLFAAYMLYHSIWGFQEPPFYDKSVGAIVAGDNIGNQRRVRRAVKVLKEKFNNNDPKFCSFGVQFC